MNRMKTFSALAAATLFASATVRADTLISSFTPGDLVILRGGDATNSNNSATGNALNGEVGTYLDEYTVAGSYVGTIPVGSGLTLPGYGSISHEGNLNLSVDGHYLTFGGYTAAAGTTPRAVDGSETESIGIIGSTAASLNTSMTITPAQGTGQFIRGVATMNGSQFWVGQKYPATVSASAPNTGLKYISGGNVTTVQTQVDWRNVILAGSTTTLYGGTGSSSVGTHGAYQIGTTGTPPTAATPANTLLTNYSGGQSASNLTFINVATSDSSAGSFNGENTLYTVGDQSTPGIVKYYYDGTTWQHANLDVGLNPTNILNPTGLVAEIDPTNSSWVDLFVSGQNGLYSYIDKSGDPLAGLPNNAFSIIATPGTDGAFYGMALAPTAAPEPHRLA